MQPTVLITGASSGIGNATARVFQRKGWNVAATMRTPSAGNDLAKLDNVLVARLDVTDTVSIADAVKATLDRFGRIDALVNNAGYGAYGPLEAFDLEGARREFETNVLGVVAVTQAVVPHMRRVRSGVIVNVSSIGGRMTFPFGSLYHASKFAIEGLSESLHFELDPVGIRIKIIQPGMVRTNFGGSALDFRNDAALSEYQPLLDRFLAARANMGTFTRRIEPEIVAETIWTAATDDTGTLRYTCDDDARNILAKRKELSDAAFFDWLKAQINIE